MTGTSITPHLLLLTDYPEPLASSLRHKLNAFIFTIPLPHALMLLDPTWVEIELLIARKAPTVSFTQVSEASVIPLSFLIVVQGLARFADYSARTNAS